MGSRGRMLSQKYWEMSDEYKCVDIVNKIKVLEFYSNGKKMNKLPDISHTKSTMYICKDINGVFHQLRLYDYSGRPIIDIDFGKHREYGDEKKLHIHQWKGSKDHGQITRLYTKKDHKKFGKYLKGLIKDEWIN